MCISEIRICCLLCFIGNHCENTAIASNLFIPKGDCNADGSFSIDDVILLQKWLLADPDTEPVDWRSCDLSGDGRLNAIDLSLMKLELLGSQQQGY